MVLTNGIANVVIKSQSVIPLESVESGSPFASGNGTLCVFSDMMDAYTNDSTWGEVISANTIIQYEGSSYDWTEPEPTEASAEEALSILLGGAEL